MFVDHRRRVYLALAFHDYSAGNIGFGNGGPTDLSNPNLFTFQPGSTFTGPGSVVQNFGANVPVTVINARSGTVKAEGISRGPLWGRLHAGEEVFFEGRTLASQDYLVMPDPAGRIVVGSDDGSLYCFGRK